MTVVFSLLLLDHQKLEREARICRLLKHPNIGECPIWSILWWGPPSPVVFCGRQVLRVGRFCVWSHVCL